jgi:hypothetical protein
MSPPKVELASPEWIAAITTALEDATRDLKTGGQTYSVSQTYTDVPVHLAPPGQTELSWHFTVTDGQVKVGRGPLPDGDHVSVIDYQSCLPVARLIYDSNSHEPPPADGGSQPPAIPNLPAELLARLVDVHNRMARITR